MATTLVLTHENADFDAVASELAAVKLDPTATPVLPRRVNRNVLNFLTVYGSTFPFVRAEDLQRHQVDRITVVDTQTFTSVKGVRPTIPTRFVDHHPLMKPPEPYQQYSGEPLGATTTLLVEQMRQAGTILSPIEATLLMLGIYEDTGSLLYGTTTDRDLAAAAWLRQQGADLDIVRQFLQQVLSDDQQQLYTRLLEDTQTYEVSGVITVISSARFERVVEEVSTLAHKIRETYDAHAVILLVAMEDYVQLIARSTVDEIDVSRVASSFGGGGHPRAAAAQIREARLEEVHRKLIDMLPGLVQPSVRVEELMSRRVHVIDGGDTVSTAASRMQRSGHEGYPVLENGKLVGLLTRRAVDRAMGHNLAASPVREVMEPGAISVSPDDSIDALQRIMMESGWGQIPVQDKEGNLLGIVTRTDVLKRWDQRQQTLDVRAGEIAHLLREKLPRGLMKILEVVAEHAQALNLSLYIVGGFVRDLLLGLPNTDIDLVVEDEAIELARALRLEFGGSVTYHAQFGTAKWIFGSETAQALAQRLQVPVAELPQFIDLVTARREFYEAPAALPTVEQGSIKLDLHRRDFTINTLAIRLSPAPFGKLLDFYGGERDLRNGIIRVLHSLSFIDDATRLLRAVRFEQRFQFTIEPATAGLISGALPYVGRVSGHRIKHEIDLIFKEAMPENVMRSLDERDILEAIWPGLKFDEWSAQAFRDARSAALNGETPSVALIEQYWVIFAWRFPDPEGLIRRLNLPSDLAAYIRGAYRLYHLLPELERDQPPSAVWRRLNGLPPVVLSVVIQLVKSDRVRSYIERYMTDWQYRRPKLTGDDLKRMGLPEGPRIGKLLAELQRALQDGEISSPDEERVFAERWLRENP